MKNYYVPAKEYIELTGSTKPTYNGYLSASYYEGENKPHYGMDLMAGLYTAIGDGEVIYVNPTNVGGGIVIRHEWTDTHDLLALYWHGKPLFKTGDKVTADDYVTNSLKPDKSLGKMGMHTHFELRIVPKNHDFVYYDRFRQCQVVDPFGILKVRDRAELGEKLLKYLSYRGIDVHRAHVVLPTEKMTAVQAIEKINAHDIKGALLKLAEETECEEETSVEEATEKIKALIK